MSSVKKQKQKIIAVVGPTASGKTELAIHLAKKFNGEVISADSRQVYKGLDIGTGKVTKKEMRGVRHHLLDVVSPKKTYTAVDFKRDAEKVIADIASRGKVPIIAGGTGFYIQAVIDNTALPAVPPDKKLRDRLEKLSAKQLFQKLQKKDPARAQKIDPHNKRRLIRALEIVNAIKKVPRLRKNKKYEILQIGIKTPDTELKKKITIRLFARIREGMIAEAKKLHQKGLSWKRMNELGLEYRYLALYLRGKILKEEMIEKLQTEIWRYAKRQKTWFKKDKRIMWFSLSEKRKIERAVRAFCLYLTFCSFVIH